jgi:hypothetical protein
MARFVYGASSGVVEKRYIVVVVEGGQNRRFEGVEIVEYGIARAERSCYVAKGIVGIKKEKA